MAKRLSKNLGNRTKLRPDQLERVAGGYGHGVIGKYDAQGQQTLKRTRAVHLAAKSAKKFVLFSDKLGRRIYVADAGLAVLTDELPLTFEISQALRFMTGFDDPEKKREYYNNYFQVAIEIKFNWLIKNT